MNIAQLFVNLGIKGGNQTLGTLGKTKSLLGEASSNALLLKGSLIGAFYGLQNLLSASGQTGTNLLNFSKATGVSAKTLQQYQYAAKQAGLANEELSSSLLNLQSTATKTLSNQGAPTGTGHIAEVLARAGDEDAMTTASFEQYMRSPDLLLQKLQKYVRAGLQQGVAKGFMNEQLKSFGLSQNMIEALHRDIFQPDVLNKAPVYSESQIAALDRARAMWDNLGNTIERVVGNFNSRHGGQLVGDLSKVVIAMGKIADEAAKISNKLGVFTKISEAATIISDGLKGASESMGKIGDVVTTIDNLLSGKINITEEFEKKKNEFKNMTPTEALSKSTEVLKQFLKDRFDIQDADGVSDFIKKNHPGLKKIRAFRDMVSPKVDAASDKGTVNNNQNVTINQNFQHPGTNAKQLGSSTVSGVKGAFQQISAQGQ